MQTKLTASGFEITVELEKYSKHKLAEVAKRVPHKLRADALCSVHFTQKKRGKEAELKTCTVLVELSGTKLRSQETTQHMYAALDIAAANMMQQLRDYAAQNRTGGLRKRLTHRAAR